MFLVVQLGHISHRQEMHALHAQLVSTLHRLELLRARHVLLGRLLKLVNLNALLLVVLLVTTDWVRLAFLVGLVLLTTIHHLPLALHVHQVSIALRVLLHAFPVVQGKPVQQLGF